VAAEPAAVLSLTEATADRAAANAIARGVGEIVGKLASLVLFAALARRGADELGVFVFAFAWTQVATTPGELGFDRYLLRKVAEDRGNIHALFYEIVRTKALRSVPVAVVSFVLIWALGYGAQTRDTIYLLTVGLIIDAISRSLFMVFIGIERLTMMAVTLVIQRVSASLLGIGALLLGYGTVAVGLTYAIGAALGLAFALVAMARTIGIERRRVPPAERRAVRRASRPYAAQDIVGILLAKVDTVLLSFLASSAAVGRYGAAYRLLESTFFLTFAVTGGFSAMFTYLAPDSEPTIAAVYQRALKLVVVLLVPCAVALFVLAEPLSRAFFGAALVDAAKPLALLAPVILLLGIIQVAMMLVTGRRDATVVVRITAVAVTANIVLNLILIPVLRETGAALAMLLTAIGFAGALTVSVHETIGPIKWLSVLASPLIAGAAMVLPTLALRSSLPAAAVVGTAVYVAVLIGVELAHDPAEVRFLASMLRRRLPVRRAR